MAQLHIWKGTEKINLTFADQPNGIVKKLVHINNNIFVSTTTSNIYYGEVQVLETGTLSIIFKRINFCVIDMASNSQYLFIVNDKGYVLTLDPNTFQVIDTIILKEDIKYCCHGYKQENEILKVKNIAVSDIATLFITENGQLWASGDQPQIDIKSQVAKKVVFFEGRSVSSIACGTNFNAVVARKIPKIIKDDTDSENDIDDIFVSTCPQCLNNFALSPQSLTSSDTCPLGLHPQTYNEDYSVASTSPMSFTSRDHLTTSVPVNNDNRSCLIPNNTKNTPGTNDDEKEIKKNPVFINTEAARQFLTEQFSWVSYYGNGKESNSEYMSSPTGLIKQNVSNMANLVYEGVKTMGDKVATLSRHVSGSSETNDARDDITGEFELLDEEKGKPSAGSLAHSLRCEEFPWSSSTASLDHDLSVQGLYERINSLIDTGNNLLATELWTWGDIKFGQLGTGDIIIRPKPVLVTKLNNTGIKKVCCGAYHALALTLDGRIYAWGKNDLNQISPEETIAQSSPKLLMVPGINNQRTRNAATGTCHSLIVIDNELYFIGKSTSIDKIVKLNISNNSQYSIKYISSSGSYSCCSTINQEPSKILNDLNREEILLEEMLTVYQFLIRPFQKKAARQDSNAYDTLCQCYIDLMNFIALNVLSLSDYSNFIGEPYEVILIANVDEFVTVYKHYLNTVCDVISLGGFGHIVKIFNDKLPQILTRTFSDKVIMQERFKKAGNEEIVTAALEHPLQELNRYKITITNLIKCNGTNMGIERLQEALIKWERMCDEQQKRQNEAKITKKFWENSGKLIEILRSPKRRLLRESRTRPISILNCSRFTSLLSHWFILLTDVFVHVIGNSHTTHPLATLWVEPLADSENLSNAISITTPEENLILYTATATERNEWLQALQNAVKCSLQKVVGHGSPRDRTTSYLFTKHPTYKDAKYIGRWSNGKPHGYGKMEWNDGKLYTGEFYKGVIDGLGKMEIPTQGIYEGQWKDGLQNGYGLFKEINGDVYDGYFKDGLPHGHGVKKEGHFMSSIGSVYVGEWIAGVKQGYGVMSDIMTGEKYLGFWSNNLKHGNGLIVTLDGIYYEGTFVQDAFMGHGIMIFEDGTHYEGEFKSAGVFGGKGILTFRSGDVLEGTMNGGWNEPVKVTANLQINKTVNNIELNSKPPSFGKLCVQPNQKWKALFRQCYQQLGISESNIQHSNKSNPNKILESQKLWENVAIIINKSCQRTVHKENSPSKVPLPRGSANKTSNDLLNKILQFGQTQLSYSSFKEIHEYLINAFESQYHPLGNLLTQVSTVYTATYGGVRVHPLLLSHAVEEFRSITMRIYEIVSFFFPALPDNDKELILESENGEKRKEISAKSLLYPILLSRVHSALFVLYALHNKKEDDAYWERLMKWNKQSDFALMTFLDIDQKFYDVANTLNMASFENDEKKFLTEAIETLQQLKTTFSPLEKLIVIRNTFEQMTKTVQKKLGETYLWTMDELLPVFTFVVARAGILKLGSEIHFIDDFMESNIKNGELDVMFTTLKACFHQILQEKVNIFD
ncbi:alsin isoform X2 [Chelonus insularis]|uniref:alsin isoform X2 n=1 Tax=Chelonus insularis TaxID=460826 RepID=UPI00158E5EDD|nr:alsin isoform X2 [Chelonus insularis]